MWFSRIIYNSMIIHEDGFSKIFIEIGGEWLITRWAIIFSLGNHSNDASWDEVEKISDRF